LESRETYDIELRLFLDAPVAARTMSRFDGLYDRLSRSAAAVGLLAMPSLASELDEAGNSLLSLRWVELRAPSGCEALVLACEVLTQLTPLLGLPHPSRFGAEVVETRAYASE
jgi:hypothetical protein